MVAAPASLVVELLLWPVLGASFSSGAVMWGAASAAAFTEQPRTSAVSRGDSPCQPSSISTSRSRSGSAASARSRTFRSTISSATSPATGGEVAAQACSSAAIRSCRTACRHCSRITLRATPISQTRGTSGTTSRRRHAMTNVSLATSSASAPPTRVTA